MELLDDLGGLRQVGIRAWIEWGVGGAGRLPHYAL